MAEPKVALPDVADRGLPSARRRQRKHVRVAGNNYTASCSNPKRFLVRLCCGLSLLVLSIHY